MEKLSKMASLKEKMDYILQVVRDAGYEEEIPKIQLELIIGEHWGHNRVTISAALTWLTNAEYIYRKNPKVYCVMPGHWEHRDQRMRAEEVAVETVYAAQVLKEDFKMMLRVYQDRHPAGMKGGTSEDQDMHWIGATKGRYGLQDMSDEDLYKKLQEGLE